MNVMQKFEEIFLKAQNNGPTWSEMRQILEAMQSPAQEEPHSNQPFCKWCNGPIAVRNPTGKCDHLYYPENVNKELKKEACKHQWIAGMATKIPYCGLCGKLYGEPTPITSSEQEECVHEWKEFHTGSCKKCGAEMATYCRDCASSPCVCIKIDSSLADKFEAWCLKSEHPRNSNIELAAIAESHYQDRIEQARNESYMEGRASVPIAYRNGQIDGKKQAIAEMKEKFLKIKKEYPLGGNSLLMHKILVELFGTEGKV